MAFTRINDDEARIAIQLQQQTDQERWYLDVPGNGDKPCFILDPQIIPQKWGANLWTHCIDIQSSLLGINTQLNRDCINTEKYKKHEVYVSPIDYPVCDKFLTTEQSRAIMPAWTARELTPNNAYFLSQNPQAHTEIPFYNNTSTRILEKDNFHRDYYCLQESTNDQSNTVPLYTVPTNVYNNQYKGKNVTGTTICKNDCKSFF
jgi:hypothetical protein